MIDLEFNFLIIRLLLTCVISFLSNYNLSCFASCRFCWTRELLLHTMGLLIMFLLTMGPLTMFLLLLREEKVLKAIYFLFSFSLVMFYVIVWFLFFYFFTHKNAPTRKEINGNNHWLSLKLLKMELSTLNNILCFKFV